MFLIVYHILYQGLYQIVQLNDRDAFTSGLPPHSLKDTSSQQKHQAKRPGVVSDTSCRSLGEVTH